MKPIKSPLFIFLCNLFLIVSLASGTAYAANPNKSNLLDRVDSLEQSVERLEQSESMEIAIDCITNPDALLDTDFKNNTTYVLTGMCTGPIDIIKVTNVKIMGDDMGTKDDGVQIPSGMVYPDAAITFLGPNKLTLENLTISGENYLPGTGYIVVETSLNSKTHIIDTDIKGGETGLGVFHNSSVILQGNVNVTGFNKYGLFAGKNGVIVTLNPITVVGLANSNSAYNEAVIATRSSSISIEGGGTFTASSAVVEQVALGAYDTSSIRVKNSGTTVLSGAVRSWRSSSVRIDAGTINGVISARLSSSLSIRNADVNSDGINVSTMSSAEFRGTTDLGYTDIDCDFQEQINVWPTVTNVGMICP